jgi:HSP20 family protein
MIFTRLQRLNLGAVSPSRCTATLRQELDNLFQQALRQPLKDGFELGPDPLPSLDLYEGKDGLVVRVELPGLKKEDIALSLEDGMLTVSGERKQDSKLDATTVCRCERALGRFERRVNLPGKVDAGKIKATYADGILTVTLPKAEEAKPKQIPINNN